MDGLLCPILNATDSTFKKILTTHRSAVMYRLKKIIKNQRPALVSGMIHILLGLLLAYWIISPKTQLTTILANWDEFEKLDLTTISLPDPEFDINIDEPTEEPLEHETEPLPEPPSPLAPLEQVPLLSLDSLLTDISQPLEPIVDSSDIPAEPSAETANVVSVAPTVPSRPSVGTGNDNSVGDQGSKPDNVNFGHGIPYQYQRIVWVVDTSASMQVRMGSTLQKTLFLIGKSNLPRGEIELRRREAITLEQQRRADGVPTRFQYMMEEMKETLSLLDEQDFSIILFHTKVFPLEGGLQVPTPRNKTKALNWMENLKETGSSEDPLIALRHAFQLNPDAIYFLTDGAFSQKFVEKITQANKKRVHIHTIGLDDPESESVLLPLAQYNNGQFRLVEYQEE